MEKEFEKEVVSRLSRIEQKIDTYETVKDVETMKELIIDPGHSGKDKGGV